MNTEVDFNSRPILNCIEHFEHPDNQWRAIYNTKKNQWYTDRGEWSDDIYKAMRFVMRTYHHTAKEDAERWLEIMQNPDSEIDDKDHLVIKILTLGVG